MIKIFLDDSIKIDTINRYDIKTRAIIAIIEELNLNDNIQWINFETFKKYEIKLLKDKHDEISDSEINHLYKEINYYLEEEKEKTESDDEEIKENIIKIEEKDNVKNMNLEEPENSNNNDEEENIEQNNSVEIINKNYNVLNVYDELINNLSEMKIDKNKENNSLKIIKEENLNNSDKNKTEIITKNDKKAKKRKKSIQCIEDGDICIHAENDIDRKVKKKLLILNIKV